MQYDDAVSDHKQVTMASDAPAPPATPSAPTWALRGRYLRVLFFFARVISSVIWWDLILRRIGLRNLAGRTRPGRYQQAAHRFRLLATRLGGVWIKVGQFLSSRLDVLPESITAELANLQDEVAPEPFEAMQREIERALTSTVGTSFAWIDETPLASASLGQVHRARLPEGDRVVVKVQRPHIHDLIRVDLASLQRVLGWLKRYRPISRRVDLDALFHEFSQTLWEEVDYLAEAENARRFAKMFAEDPGIRIPRVYASHTTRSVLTLEDVYFIKITDFDAIEAADVDRGAVAERLFQTYLQQIFVEGFFHADPHPGNLFVEPLEGGAWRLVFVDFGMVGHVTPDMKQGLRDLAIAIGTRDLDRLMQAYRQMGVILPGADLERIRLAEATMLERVWGKSMTELIRTHPEEMRRFANEFRDLLYEMPFQLPADLLFLGRCVAILSGMCTGLNPEFNLFEGLQPFAEQLLAGEGEAWFSELLEVLVEQGRVLMTLPSRLDAMLARVERGELTVTARAAPELNDQLRKLTLAVQRLVGAGIFAALIIAGSLLYTSDKLVEGWIGFGLAALTLLWTLLSGRMR
jgi:predicted unusual protein kinase regulating ubiquinone biosynthesis (AarF/ABC1/UbiB family)